MTATLSVVTELLIIGFQVIIWLGLLLLTILGYDGLQALDYSSLKDWQTTILVVVLLVAYIFGMIFDRLADSLFVTWDNRIRRKFFANVKLPFVTMRFELSKDNGNLHNYFEYSRSRIRLTRASAVNFGLITVLSLALLFTRGQWLASDNRLYYGFWIIVLGTLLTVTSTFAWYKLTLGYFTLVTTSYEAYRKDPDKKRVVKPS